MSLYRISSPSKKNSMTFSPKHGGLGVSLIVNHKGNQRELLYFPDNFKLDEYTKISCGWPFIFPICARLSRADGEGRYLYQGKIYHMPIHGFAHRLPWSVVEHQNHRLVMSLTESELSLAEYPFQFHIILDYELTDQALICRQTYSNTGNGPLPYYAGFHPYFSVPFPKDQVTLHYEPKRRLQYNPKLTDIIGEIPTFATPASLSLPELNESLVELGDNKWVDLNFPDHTQLKMKVEGIDGSNLFPYIQLYHIPSKPFICIEPWMAHPNAMNTVSGVRWLQPGASEQGLLECKLVF